MWSVPFGPAGFNELRHFTKVSNQCFLVFLCFDKSGQITSVVFKLKLFLYAMNTIINNVLMA